MRSPDNLESPNSSETWGGEAPVASQGTQRALGATALNGVSSQSRQRAVGAAAIRSSAASAGGQANPAALEQAANRLEDIARKLVQVAQTTQSYQSKVDPIAQGVEQEVGGSATGMDKQIATLLKGVARDVRRSASASHQAAEVAKRLAAQARSEAQEIRRQQEAERQSRGPGQRR